MTAHIRLLFLLGLFHLGLAIPPALTATRDQGRFVNDENTYEKSLLKRAAETAGPEQPGLKFKLDVSDKDLPRNPQEFQQAWHQPPRSQDLTGACWSFSSTSFFESEVYRVHGRRLKLSEMFTVYWEYVEKTREFVRTRGTSYFGRGSQANATPRLWKQYGIVPFDVYDGRCPGSDIFDDHPMFDEMKTYLASVKESASWNEVLVVETIRAILDRYMTPPPASFVMYGKTFTPLDYLHDVVSLNMDDYVCVLSLKEKPYWEKVEYPVPDNWWHSPDYYNVPLDDFMAAIHGAVRQGFTLNIVGDNSEPGFIQAEDVALVPDFDIPPPFINDDARQMRFSNEATTDDHAIHLVGWMEKDGQDWYLIKDSGTRAQNGRVPGYMFYREDFVKLKMMYFMVHRDAVGNLMERFKR
ncbi:MAG: C1 family peptidase [Candidatus Sumerlaeia bacterium]